MSGKRAENIVKRKEDRLSGKRRSFHANSKSKGCHDDNIQLFFIAWGKVGKEFMEGTTFCSTPEHVRVHVFYSKGTPKEDLPRFTTWMIGHESLTTSEDAVWIDLTAFVFSINSRFAVHETCARCKSKLKISTTIVWGDCEKGLELEAILNANKMNVTVIEGRSTRFIDMFRNVCRCCNVIFKDPKQAEAHDRERHNFLCHNIQCERSKRGNGFYTYAELEHHLRTQKFCKFCPSDAFCKSTMLNRHIKDKHRYCPCSCNDYYERDEDLFEQYYATYPLPCLEVPACKARFKNIDKQAFHHKIQHGSDYPYFCMACYKNEKLVCVKTAEELLEHAGIENHVVEDFQFAIIPRKMIEERCE